MAKTRGGPKAKTKRGPARPPTTGTGRQIQVRCHTELLKHVDAWRAKQEGEISRPDAIRRLAEIGLAGMPPIRQQSSNARAKAHDLAGQQLDKLTDQSASAEEQQKRKRRLLKGPREFRDIRGDLSKPKDG